MAVKRRIGGGSGGSVETSGGTTVATSEDGSESPAALASGTSSAAGSLADGTVGGGGTSCFSSAKTELELLESVLLHKPAGVSKHFQMALILHRLTASNPDLKNIKAEAVWSHLNTLFDMEAANEIEAAAAAPSVNPSDTSTDQSEVSDFSLPLKEFYKALTEMNMSSMIQIQDANVFFGSSSTAAATTAEKSGKGSEDGGNGGGPKTPSGGKRPGTRSTPNSTPSTSKRRK